MNSECISSSSSEPQFKQDIEIGGASYEYFPQDGSALGGCWLRNNGEVEYTKVKINLEVFDKEGNSIENQTIVVGKLSLGETINWISSEGYAPLPDGTSAKATVINATSSE